MIPSDAARDSLEGLALGDAFGERWFPVFRPARFAFDSIRARRTPEESPWHWTDDTAMALALVLNALVLFNTRYMDAALTRLRADGLRGL